MKTAVDDLFNNRDLSAAAAIDRHFAAAFRQRTNGTWDDHTVFLTRITDLRETVEHAAITVLDEVADGSRYAERHVIDLAFRNGDRVRQEVYVFAERGLDGRCICIEEMTLTLGH